MLEVFCAEFYFDMISQSRVLYSTQGMTRVLNFGYILEFTFCRKVDNRVYNQNGLFTVSLFLNKFLWIMPMKVNSFVCEFSTIYFIDHFSHRLFILWSVVKNSHLYTDFSRHKGQSLTLGEQILQQKWPHGTKTIWWRSLSKILL